MKRNTLALFILLLLFSCLLMFASINLVTANPAHLFHFPWDNPITTPPQIIIYSPDNNQSCNSPNLLLNFSVIKPDNWYYGGVRATGVEVFGKITAVYCILEDGQRYNFTVNDWDSPHDPCNKTSLDFSTNITFESAGAHNIKVFAQAFTYYVIYDQQFGFYIQNAHLKSESATVNFTIFHKHPNISISSSLKNSYNESSVPVEFFIDVPVSQIEYCLDGAENTIVLGNFTLSGLSNGNHSLAIYAKDYSETLVASETSFFSVDVPDSFPTTLMVTISGLSSVIIGATLILSFKKQSRDKSL